MPFETQLIVAFNDIDAAGIVYFGTVFDYCHRAYERVLEAIDIPLPHILNNERWAMPLVHAEADYVAPMRHGEQITVQVKLQRLGRSSMHFHYELSGEDGDVRARVVLVHAAVETPSFKPQSLNSEFVKALASIGLTPND